MIDGMIVAKYFLYLDKRNKYFVDKHIKLQTNDEEKTSISAGKFRINKLLYIANILYIAKYNEQLFNETTFAYKFGPIIDKVYSNFKVIKAEKNKNTDFLNLNDSIKHYLEKIYKIFSKYSDQELLNFVHEDPNWFLVYEKSEKNLKLYENNPKDEIIFNQKSFQFYKDHLNIYINHFNL